MSTNFPDPAVLNSFDDEAEAIEHAKHWSKVRREEWTVIHGLSGSGLKFFAELGDGGMIRNTERLVARFDCGKAVQP